MDFFRNLLQLPSSVSVSMKLPKFKKLRQWSHDSIVNLSQLTIRTANNNSSHSNTAKQKQFPDNPLPTTGITTISSAIHEQQIDPKKDNLGLYALKCDRSRTLANARRGILLNLPSSSKLKLDNNPANNFQSVERNHEIFKSCEIMSDGEENAAERSRVRVEPPPRKKKKMLAPHLSALHHKPKQMAYQQVTTKTGIQSTTTISMESLEKNESGLYRIVGSTDTARITYVEPKKKETIIAVVKPKVEKAILVKSTPMPKPLSKVKNAEMNRVNQRRASTQSNSNLKKADVKKYAKCHSFDASRLTKTESIDIFKSNRIMDQKKLFDEFDALFEKNKAWEENRPEMRTPAVAFEKLAELKKQSSSTFSSIESGHEDSMSQKVNEKNLARAKYVNSLLQQADDIDDVIDEKENYAEKALPKIISEQVKQHVEINKKKIVYYDDESELQQDMIMRRSQMKSSTKLLTMDVNVKDTDTTSRETSLSENKAPTQHTAKLSTGNSSNSLKIFSNEGDKIFVFNL